MIIVMKNRKLGYFLIVILNYNFFCKTSYNIMVIRMSLNKFNGCELIALASTIAIIIGENNSIENISTLSALFNAIGDNLAIIALDTGASEQN